MKGSIDRYLEVKSEKSYSEPLLKNIKMVSFYPEGMATPFGSFIYKMQKYPGDVDLLEEFKDCCTKDDVVKKFIKNLHRVVKEIIKSPLHYFSEFKAGIDHVYDVDIGTLSNGVYYINNDLRDLSVSLYNNNFFDEYEITRILTVIDKNITNSDAYDEIFNIYRNRRILRWTEKEILDNKKVIGNRIKTLYDALFDHTHVKIDVILLYNNRFIEMTNFVGLTLINPKGEESYINIKMQDSDDIQKDLPIEIEKLFFSNYYYSPFKMTKRIYSLSRNKGDEETIIKILPLISGDVSLLYQIKSEIEVLIRLYEINKNPPSKTIYNELDEMKGRIATVLFLNNEKQQKIFYLIDSINRTKDNKEKLNLLIHLSDDILKPEINYNTIKYLNEIGFNPPPSYLLPQKLTYSRISR